ncbi:MAG: hypothetical protein KDD40_04560, partial [Bdellovibrionales bacterium]|nr:hypothetical protein [Bdellovibrionales bacterium]
SLKRLHKTIWKLITDNDQDSFTLYLCPYFSDGSFGCPFSLDNNPDAIIKTFKLGEKVDFTQKIDNFYSLDRLKGATLLEVEFSCKSL